MRTPIVGLLGLLASAPAVVAQAPPALPDADRVRIAEAFRLADALGDRVWPDWGKSPFVVLLVTPDREFLVRHPKPTDDFTPLGKDPTLGREVWSRKRTYPTNLLATFPAIGGVPTVVIGQPENTQAKTSARWVITLLHEHFHQLQSSRPGYYADVDALGLAGGDKTGVWMLNYPFPYTDPAVRDQFAATAKALAEALRARQKPEFAERLASYVSARGKFKSVLKADDYKYFSFQVWQEGVARYTEYRLAELASAECEPSERFRGLKDYAPFKDVARSIMDGIEKELVSVRLDKSKREVVYNIGAAECLVLDRARPGWRDRYFEEKFSLDAHFAAGK
jgi:hypothetical protein